MTMGPQAPLPQAEAGGGCCNPQAGLKARRLLRHRMVGDQSSP
jgi:hypothetical protein